MTVFASFISDFWHDQLVAQHRQGMFVVLLAFLLSFGFIRTSARLMRSPRVPWWPGSVVSDSGVHLHHLVWGICLMMGGGSLAITLHEATPWFEVCCAFFGVGMGLTIDEFALWVYLDDVYWAKEGRASIDATVLAGVFMTLILLGARPFDVATGDTWEVVDSIISAIIVLLPAAISFRKGRLYHGAVGIFLPPLSIYAACRIAKPNSAWAKKRYASKPNKLAKAQERFRPDRRTDRIKDAVRTAIGGSTEMTYEAKLAAEHAATVEAASAVRERAALISRDE